MLCFVSFESRCRRNDRIRYWVLARSVCRIDSFRLILGLLELLFDALVLMAPGSEADAAKSSMVSIWFMFISTTPFLSLPYVVYEGVELTCPRIRSIIRSIRPVGHGRSSDTARSATHMRVRSWWSSVADSGALRLPRSTEARISSMSIFGRGLRGSWSACLSSFRRVLVFCAGRFKEAQAERRVGGVEWNHMISSLYRELLYCFILQSTVLLLVYWTTFIL